MTNRMKDMSLCRQHLALVVALASLLLPARALAAPGSWAVDGGYVNQGGDAELRLRSPGEAVDVSAHAVGNGQGDSVWIGVPRIGNSGDPDGGNGGFCRRMEWVRVPREDASVLQAQAEQDYLDAFAPLALDREGVTPNVACPEDPADELPVELVEDLLTATVSEQLPRPALSLPPGFAITGLRTYLVTGHTLDFGPVSTPVELGPATFDVRFEARGESTVDWGDGTVTTHDVAGTGYPDGAIDHVYTDVGTVDITVTDAWTVDYEAGPFAGTLDAPLAPVVLSGVEVQERQAVRVH